MQRKLLFLLFKFQFLIVMVQLRSMLKGVS